MPPPGGIWSPTPPPESPNSTVMLQAFHTIGTPSQIGGETPGAMELTLTLKVHMYKGFTREVHRTNTPAVPGRQWGGKTGGLAAFGLSRPARGNAPNQSVVAADSTCARNVTRDSGRGTGSIQTTAAQKVGPEPRVKPPEATHKPTTSHILGSSEPPSSHPHGTPMRTSSHLHATPKPGKCRGQVWALAAHRLARRSPAAPSRETLASATSLPLCWGRYVWI
jgi:hypothetical protein